MLIVTSETKKIQLFLCENSFARTLQRLSFSSVFPVNTLEMKQCMYVGLPSLKIIMFGMMSVNHKINVPVNPQWPSPPQSSHLLSDLTI